MDGLEVVVLVVPEVVEVVQEPPTREYAVKEPGEDERPRSCQDQMSGEGQLGREESCCQSGRMWIGFEVVPWDFDC